ncbi:hypothetical protein QM012_001525 [Aureobasidium pullulans]|uniref:Endo-1,3(4)-beta-glucanase 1 carbohydrate binding domain-containing protein n=1 Tax=Aureobasidium pullulans TaxID=5580 RepID=A0ABR0TEC6_AURPU
MKWQTSLLPILSFGLLASADPEDCGDPMMPQPVHKISCGTWLEDLGCKWSHDFVDCVQTCRRQKGLNRLIYHNHHYYDISEAEYDEIIKAKEKQQSASCVSSEYGATVTVEATKAGSVDHTTTRKQTTGFETVIRTITHAARQPPAVSETAAAATQTSSDLWWTHTKAIGPSTTTGAVNLKDEVDDDNDSTDDQDHEASHPHLDLYCAKTSQVAKCRVKCGIHIFGGFPKCMKKCARKCHENHPIHSNGEEDMVKRAAAAAAGATTQTSSSSSDLWWTHTTAIRPLTTATTTEATITTTDSTGTLTSSSDLWWTHTKAIETSIITTTTATIGAAVAEHHKEDEQVEPPHHPRIDYYCSKETEMWKCRQRCA